VPTRTMTVEPETQYAKAEEGYVGYQVIGQGPFDILFIGNWVSNIEVMWEHPSMVRYLNRLGSFARVIAFDKRGSGVSDPVPLGALPTLEQWTDDARVVMDAAGSERPALIGDAEGGPMAMLFGALSGAHQGAGPRQYLCEDAPGRGLSNRDASRGGRKAARALGTHLGNWSRIGAYRSERGRRRSDAAMG
jgi:alpha-beta hydrolase superfamily lysophospholipase